MRFLFALCSLLVAAPCALGAPACKSPHPPPPNEPPPQVGPAGADPDEARLQGSASAAPSAYPLVVLDASAPSPTAVALGLHEGDALGPVVIAGFLPLKEGRLPVVVRQEQSLATLQVALRGEGPPPPATTQQYAVYWDRTPAMTPEVLSQAAVALAARLRVVEKTGKPPEGLGVFGSGGP